MSIEPTIHTDECSAHPETVAKLVRQVGLRNASAVQQADALRAWSDNVPNPGLSASAHWPGPILIRGLGLTFVGVSVVARTHGSQCGQVLMRLHVFKLLRQPKRPAIIAFVHVTPVRAEWSRAAMFHLQAGSRS